MRYCIVLNASAGSLLGKKMEEVERDIKSNFAKTSVDIEIRKPEGTALVETLEDAAKSGFDAVIVGGGDGTIATAASVLGKHDLPLGIIPLGTMNMLARDLNLPTELEAAIAALAGGTVRAIDMGEVNGEPFLCNSTLGLVPQLGQERELQRGKPLWIKIPALIRQGIATLYRWPGHTLTLEYEGKTLRVMTRLLTIANNEYSCTAEGFLPRQCLDGGKLAVYVARHKSRLGLLWFSIGILFRFWQSDKLLETIKVERLTVKSRRRFLDVCNDGEIKKLRSPLNYKILPKALKVIGPK
jgi:diacylglycerol kinase family enzyme